MNPDEVFVLCIIALVMVAGVARSWVRARHGLPERKRGRGALAAAIPADAIDADRKIRLLSDENATQAGKVSRLEERIAVLERIATDPAERTAREIDALRDR